MIKFNYLSYTLILLAIVSGGLFVTNLNQWITETQTYGTVLTPKESDIIEIILPENDTYQYKPFLATTNQFFSNNHYYAFILENELAVNFSIYKIGFNEDLDSITTKQLINTSLNRNLRLIGLGIFNDNFITIQRINYNIYSRYEEYLLFINPDYGIIRNVSLPYPQWQDYNITYNPIESQVEFFRYLSSFHIKGDSLWIQRFLSINSEDGWHRYSTLLEYDVNTVSLRSKQEITEISPFPEGRFYYEFTMFDGSNSVWFVDPNGDPYHDYNGHESSDQKIKASYIEYSLDKKQFGKILLLKNYLPRSSLYDITYNNTIIYNNETVTPS